MRQMAILTDLKDGIIDERCAKKELDLVVQFERKRIEEQSQALLANGKKSNIQQVQEEED